MARYVVPRLREAVWQAWARAGKDQVEVVCKQRYHQAGRARAGAGMGEARQVKMEWAKEGADQAVVACWRRAKASRGEAQRPWARVQQESGGQA